ncbi:MAG: hypoxanthine phosphoribosyltransferase [bacterium]|nr:hypoxanthine phosphoribosyltransferase [bacterium]
MKNDIEKVLFSSSEIAAKIRTLVRNVLKDFRNEKTLVMVALLKGSVFFLADLIRQINRPVEFDFIGTSSYEGSTVSKTYVEIYKDLTFEVKGKSVILVDDILDTGKTAKIVKKHLLDKGAKEVKLCVLLDKPARREVDIKADYAGFEIDDVFVVGYGLDFKDKYRNLPYIAVLKKKHYN